MAVRKMSSDKKQDAKAMKGLSPAKKVAFKKADVAMDKKGLTRKQDIKADKALAAKLKKSK